MAGKRILDAAKLINASSAVARQHIRIRREQWDVYNRTSSLAKAVKDQTDRVTVTAAAAVELARRFSEKDTPHWQDDARRWDEAEATADRTEETVREAGAKVREAGEQGGAVVNQLAADVELGAGQVRERDNGTLSSLRKRELQRQSERQIPSVTADAQSTAAPFTCQDTFSDRSGHVSPELSSLPRTKLPKHPETVSGQADSLREHATNPDTYPVPERPAASAEPEPEDFNAELFSNPRVSRMLARDGASAGLSGNPYAKRQRAPPQPLPEMVAARKRWEAEQQAASKPKVTESTAIPVESPVADTEVEELAASLAQSAQDPPSHQTSPNASEDTSPKPFALRESRVPSSRFGRFWQYTGLASSMAFGAAGESLRRLTGGSGDGSLMLSEANMNRLVAKLSRMRGAALKLGQMMSFQDSKVLPPMINEVLQRVQDSADYMPASQRNAVLTANLGPSWRDLFGDFAETPFAAASIGQVHKATLAESGRQVAVKIQYPGVRSSIDSDLNNLSLLLTASRLLPKGLFLDRTIANARTELGWECDYEREATSCVRFRELVADEPDTFAVPEIFPEACGKDVLTAEFMQGTAVTKIADLSQQERDWLGSQVLRLCLRELMEWRFMQTDPNWTNFLYNRSSRKLELLDFGASRDFPTSFIEPYVALLIAASKNDRETCRTKSIELGYLSGSEGPEMLKAHVDSILTLAEPFVDSAPETYDFDGQTITDRVRSNIGLMLRERQKPPPEETYSLHRKLSGAFLLCARLRSRVQAREMFADAVRVWEARERKIAGPSQ